MYRFECLIINGARLPPPPNSNLFKPYSKQMKEFTAHISKLLTHVVGFSGSLYCSYQTKISLKLGFTFSLKQRMNKFVIGLNSDGTLNCDSACSLHNHKPVRDSDGTDIVITLTKNNLLFSYLIICT